MTGASDRASGVPKGRVPLTIDEILELDAALVQAFRTIAALRQSYRAAKHIKFPPLPAIFSESLVIAAAHRIFGAEWSARYGGTECDVLIESVAGVIKRVEVKATAQHGFQEFKAKDLRADTLVWVRFGGRFQQGSGPIEVTLLNEPGRVIDRACRLDVSRFEKRLGGDADVTTLRFSTLEELLDA